jgi:adenylosuccinate lyase
VIQRDRHAELLTAIAITGASLEKFALEVRGLQKTEIGEVEEPFDKGQKGSSAMPHKRNPIGCEQITGLARLLRGNAHAALENVALWHERDISHSSVERVILPDSFIALDHMLRRFTRIVAGLVVYPTGCARTSAARAASCFPAPCCWSWRSEACRASRPTSGCSATPCAPTRSREISRSCCWRTRT